MRTHIDTVTQARRVRLRGAAPQDSMGGRLPPAPTVATVATVATAAPAAHCCFLGKKRKKEENEAEESF